VSKLLTGAIAVGHYAKKGRHPVVSPFRLAGDSGLSVFATLAVYGEGEESRAKQYQGFRFRHRS